MVVTWERDTKKSGILREAGGGSGCSAEAGGRMCAGPTVCQPPWLGPSSAQSQRPWPGHGQPGRRVFPASLSRHGPPITGPPGPSAHHHCRGAQVPATWLPDAPRPLIPPSLAASRQVATLSPCALYLATPIVEPSCIVAHRPRDPSSGLWGCTQRHSKQNKGSRADIILPWFRIHPTPPPAGPCWRLVALSLYVLP